MNEIQIPLRRFKTLLVVDLEATPAGQRVAAARGQGMWSA